MEKKVSFGKYTVLEVIGRGRFGIVVRAIDQALDIKRAIKVIYPNIALDRIFIQHLKQEIQQVVRLRNPHIIQIHDFDSINNRIHYVMDYVPGGSLRHHIDEHGPIPFEKSIDILNQIADAIDQAHEQGLVHRDLKPENILFNDSEFEGAEDSVFLGDFGLVQALAAADEKTIISITGGFLGTPAYMAPEAWDNQDITPAVDIYSFACVAYEMLVGKILFAGESPVEIMKKHTTEGPRYPASWDLRKNQGRLDIFTQALSKDPTTRFRTAREFISAIETSYNANLQTSGIPVEQKKEQAQRDPSDLIAKPETRDDPEPKRKKRLIIGGVTILIATLSVLGLLYGQFDRLIPALGEIDPLALLKANPTITNTPAEIEKSTSTPQPTDLPTSTSVVEPRHDMMVQLINDLHQNDDLSTTDGQYHEVPDEELSFAKIGAYHWLDTGLILGDFVVQSEVSLDNSTDTPNLEDAGCGYVFRYESEEDHYVIRLTMDGYVTLSRIVDGRQVDLGVEYYGPVFMDDLATKLTLVMDGTHIKFFVNDERVLHRTGQGLYKGMLTLAVFSGTNKQPGTTCDFQKVDIWELPYVEPTPP